MNEPYLLTEDNDRFYLDTPELNSYSIYEIGSTLAKLCRYGGMCPYFYSVAQHSVFVSEAIEDMGVEHKWERWPYYSALGLFHDANERGYSDLPSPLKHLVKPEYEALKDRCERYVFQCLGLADYFDFFKDILKAVDTEARVVERAMFNGTDIPKTLKWITVRENSAIMHKDVQWKEAYLMFVERIDYLKSAGWVS